jgi:hypothetical protein
MTPSLSQFTGTWIGRRTDCLEEDFYFRILPDGRHVGVIPYTSRSMAAVRHRFVRMRLRLSIASATILFVRYRLDRPGHLSGYRLAGDRLIFTTLPGREFACWECRRVAAEQLPPWFESNFAIALNRPWR